MYPDQFRQLFFAAAISLIAGALHAIKVEPDTKQRPLVCCEKGRNVVDNLFTRGLTVETVTSLHYVPDLEVRLFLPKERQLKLLSKLVHVEKLTLVFSKIADEELKHFVNLTNLEVINIEGLFSDDGLDVLVGMKKLKSLMLSSPFVTGKFLGHLLDLPIELLSVHGEKFNDDSMHYLKDLSELRELNLKNTSVSDASIDIILSLNELKKLDVTNTLLSSDGIEALRARKPNLDIMPRHNEDGDYVFLGTAAERKIWSFDDGRRW